MKQSLKQNYIDELIKSGGIKVATDTGNRFTQRNGGQTWAFFDHGDLICSPKGNRAFVDALRGIIEPLFPRENTTLLNIVSRCGPQITGAVAYASSYPQIPLQAEETKNLEKGTFRILRLPDMDNIKNLVITDDVLTSGTTAIETIHIVKKYIDIDKLDIHIVVGFAKNPEKVEENLKKYKITPHWIATRNEVLTQMWPSFNNIQREGLKVEFPDFKEVIEELDKKS